MMIYSVYFNFYKQKHFPNSKILILFISFWWNTYVNKEENEDDQ